MKKFIVISLFFLMALNAQVSDRAELVKEIAKINEIKKSILSDAAKWREEKQSLALQSELLTREISEEQEIKKSSLEQKEVLFKKIKALQAEIAQNQAKVSRLQKGLDQHILSIKEKWHPWLPPAYRKQLQEDYLDIFKQSVLSAKLSSIDSYYNKYFNLQTSTQISSSLITIDGQEWQIDVLMIGTLYGYFSNDKITGVYHLHQGEWKAELRPELKEKIQLAFKQYDRVGRPQLVKLPVQGAKL